MSTITRWLLSAFAFVLIGGSIVWAWLTHRKSQARDNELADQAAELGELKGQEQADRVTDAGAAALERVKEADAKADKEVQDAVAKPGGLVGYLRGIGRR